ncbi:NUDIX hydrolase [Alteribacter natronophilus]|uniref:NUDIX hydrolase n=1 Tax=Alteribacter natronophilus TaxID=2583810 RepID=UPI00110E024E|nr:NUDIX domain-containing protein [Alteribacter natronophilus]TMW73453.1 NUDIX domain-containing protein [Alteribacter natronophilus]
MFVVNVEGAVHSDGKWLMIRRSDKEDHASGMIALPGGKAEREGNTSDILERTVKREIEEETGVLVHDKLTYVHNTSFVTEKGIHVVDIVFLCKYKSGEASAKDPNEVSEVLWMTAEEILEDPFIEIWPKNSIRFARQKLSGKEGEGQ